MRQLCAGRSRKTYKFELKTTCHYSRLSLGVGYHQQVDATQRLSSDDGHQQYQDDSSVKQPP